MNKFEKAYRKIISEASDDFSNKLSGNGFNPVDKVYPGKPNSYVFNKDYEMGIAGSPYYVTIKAFKTGINGKINFIVKFLLVDKNGSKDDDGNLLGEGTHLVQGSSELSIEDAFEDMKTKLSTFVGKLEEIADSVFLKN